MAVPYQPQNLSAEQADGNILLTWTGSLGASNYQIQRSTDGVNFTNLALVLPVTQYIDSYPGVGIMYYYQVAAVNISGTSTYSSVAQMVAAPSSEMSLYELRLRAQQTADRVQSNFVLTTEWNAFLRLACYELYDLLIDSYEDLFADQYVFINTNGNTANYPLPDGATNYLGGTYPNTNGQAPAQAFYKLAGMDLGINTSNNAWVTLLKYDFIERNKYIYPNSTSTIYGVYNMRYRLMGKNVNIIPTPAGNQQIRMWYSPRLPALLKDTDLTTIGFSGWLRYPIVRAAKYALDKEESNTDKLDAEIAFLKTRIEEASQNRDAGIADTISQTRQDPLYGGMGFGSQGGANAGWAFAPLGLIPTLMQNNIGNGTLIDPVLVSQLLLGTIPLLIFFAYCSGIFGRNFSSRIAFARARNLFAFGLSSFSKHICRIIGISSKKQVIGANASRIIASMTNDHTIGDRSKMNHPRCSVRNNIPSRTMRTQCTNSSVTIPKTFGIKPAFLRFSNIFPKFFNVKSHVENITSIKWVESSEW